MVFVVGCCRCGGTVIVVVSVGLAESSVAGVPEVALVFRGLEGGELPLVVIVLWT